MDLLDSLERTEQIQKINSLGLEIARMVDRNCTSNNCSGNGSCVEDEEENDEMVCECSEGFFLFDCSLNDEEAYINYLSTKKAIYDQVNFLLAEIPNEDKRKE